MDLKQGAECSVFHLPGEREMEGWNGTDRKTAAVSTSPERLRERERERNNVSVIYCKTASYGISIVVFGNFFLSDL